MPETSRWVELRRDAELRQQVKRLMPAHRALVGDVNAMDLEDAMQQVAFSIYTLETYPQITQTHGGPFVVQRSRGSYSLLLRGPELIPEKMIDAKAHDKFVPVEVGPWVVGEMIQP